MAKTIISEGKTTNEAIEKGLKELKANKKDVEIKVIKEDNKKSFFDILAPRSVKVEITLKDNKIEKNDIKEYKQREEIKIFEKDFEQIKNNISKFLEEFIDKIGINDVTFSIVNNEKNVNVEINGKNTNILIGYRGDTLNSLQTIISRIGNKGLEEKHRIIVDVEGYREKRIKVLEGLALRISKKVEKSQKSVALEPMSAFERKIIHNKLQENSNVTTYSVGKEPHRRIVIDINN